MGLHEFLSSAKINDAKGIKMAKHIVEEKIERPLLEWDDNINNQLSLTL
jgi:hypothetical protein